MAAHLKIADELKTIQSRAHNKNVAYELLMIFRRNYTDASARAVLAEALLFMKETRLFEKYAQFIIASLLYQVLFRIKFENGVVPSKRSLRPGALPLGQVCNMHILMIKYDITCISFSGP